ncbi:hypothetical protein J5N97_026863 [Dioscorea zingiberensis]|uniref:5'-nucleotidase domain-containing protein n=1 Tax=Dioscorea zingiberensis TaxID=325984 RepID=A0A9D5C3N5_9LILI|nr:hypothetical protein J5N97_026863 [Dioscorea zingiberensis]
MVGIRSRFRFFASPCSHALKSAFLASSSSVGSREGFGMGARGRGFSTNIISELRNYNQLSSIDAEDELEMIRREFQEAKRSFLNIPAALKEMPKMNPEGIYVNKNLRLGDVQVYGFDYDYTLAHYSKNLQSLIYDLAKEYLVNELKYPESCLQFEYDSTFPIRGLYYDRLKGCLLKLDFFGSIEPDGCFFGRHKLSMGKIREIYGTRHIGRDQARGLVGLMDLFCFSEACLIADIVQHFVDDKLDFDASYVYQDVNQAIQHVHQSGLVHRTILSDPHKYLMKNDFGDIKDSWRDLFDVIIAQANKPCFYTSEHPFRCYDIQKDTLAFTAVDRFLPDQVYYHGCLKSFLQITKWNGPEVIYFGDHLFSDLRGPSKAGWRTAAIIHELEARFHRIQELLGKFHATVSKCRSGERYQPLLEELNVERRNARAVMRSMFNSSFGATFLTDTGQESAFAYHIHQYADVYTSKPDNFLLYPSEAWLHVPFDIKIMPHHVKNQDLCPTWQVPSSLFKAQL